ncbi:MAG: hypothetical protein RLZZ326_1990 [Planctomycetota bacterium]|jgi:hypothetical protein
MSRGGAPGRVPGQSSQPSQSRWRDRVNPLDVGEVPRQGGWTFARLGPILTES